MDCHAKLFHWVLQIIVFIPQEPQKILMFLADCETIKHLLHICSNCDWFFAETDQDAKKSVVQIRTTKEHVVERNFFIFSAGIEHYSYLIWLVWMVNAEEG